MLNFLQPILLWAGAAITVPILIHLWNVRKGKTLKVGSIFLFTNGAKSRAQSITLKELLLLLIRCLLLITLAMLIAKPMLKTKNNEQKKGWIMIPENGLKPAYQTYKTLIDSLVKAGYQVHNFDSGFAEINLQNALQKKEDTTTETRLSYWTLLKNISYKKTMPSQVYLFTDRKLQHWTGARLQLSQNIKWHSYQDADTSSAWMEKAYKTGADSIRLITGKSDSSVLKFSYQNLSFNSSGNQYKLKNENGKWFVRSLSSSQQIAVDTSVVRIAIYTNKYVADANYVSAAINAIKDFMQRNIVVTMANNINTIPENFEWLFWLSDEALPQLLAKNNVFLYENGQIKNNNSFLVADDIGEDENIAIYQSVVSDSSLFQTAWKDGFGNPVLSVQKGNASVYHFYNRFHPQWNDLVWSNAFPQAIYQLLFESATTENNFDVHDKRLIDLTQIEAAFSVPAKEFSQQNDFQNKDLSKLFWIIAFVLFFIERIVSFYSKRYDA